VSATAARERLLEGLNEPQREAVIHDEGPLLVLAGAGSGKTRVLTHRIAYAVETDRAAPGEILAITFTNKAAKEMGERVEMLVGRRSRAMWLMTFHSACARMLRAEGPRLGYTRGFTIYDEADSVRLVKHCIDALDVDPKRFTPRAIKRQISDAKNTLLDAAGYRETVGSFFEQTAADVYELYEKRIHAANAMDFDDLLVRCVDLLQLFPEVREGYQQSFRHVLVDEYQDTNRAQYRWLQLLASEHRQLCVVGDDDQCLVEGTLVTMGDGSTKPIETVREGDEVLSSYGSGDFRPARVSSTVQRPAEDLIEITTAAGRRIVSTPEHVHFAGYHRSVTPALHMTYLMWRRDKGFRLGTSRSYPGKRWAPVSGVHLRSVQEHADAAWVLSTHDSEGAARAEEVKLSLRYGIPTLPFVARKGGSVNGLVCDQALIDDVFAHSDALVAGRWLLRDLGLSFDHPHHSPATHEGRRRNVTVTLCADRRGSTAMHSIAMGGRDPEVARRLREVGLNVRPARRGSSSWRYESSFKDFEAGMSVLERIRGATPVTVRCRARLGSGSEDAKHHNSLPFMPAASVRPGMAMFGDDGEYDVVTDVQRIWREATVYDLNVEGTHNFVAEGLVTHNSIYAFRGADIRNILDFEDDFPDARVIKLEQNYRSTQNILSAANAVVSNNRARKHKALWTDAGEGDPVRVAELEDEHAEARYVTDRIERHVEEGGSRSEVAVFYRTNAQSRVLEDMLVRYNVSYQVIGGTRFYERAEVKDAIAYLTLLTNPQDVVAFERVVNSPRRGIGNTTQARIVSHANTTGEAVWEVALVPEEIPGLGAAPIKAVGRFMSTMERLKEWMGAASVGDLLQQVLDETGYLEALRAERTIEAEGRVENLEELVSVAREYDATAEEPNLEEFLQQIALFSEQDNLSDDEGVVTLMTLHNAKGLEFPVVFMLGCEDGVFPHSRAIESGDLEEERRLCYVGITRARTQLFMTFARTRSLYGGREWNMPSRFLDELPDHLVERETQEPKRFQQSWSTRESLGTGSRWGGGGRAAGGGRAGGGVGSSPAPQRKEPIPGGGASFSLGDDVVHASLGEGVVTGVEPGGVVVVRFASDGSERKLMSDYAPLKKR
jgi:DNA helicase-2/ATP-dependent DNA helicase PcrA